MDQLQRIAQAKTRLVECMPFFGRLTLHLKPRLARFGDFVSSMAISPDGTLVVNEIFCSLLDGGELAACLVHEVLHVALLYWDRLQERLPLLFNEAQDYCINLIIFQSQDSNIYLPQFLLLKHEYENMSAEEIYDILFDKRKSPKEKNRPMLYDCRGDLSECETIDWKEALRDALQFHIQMKGRGSLPKGLAREVAQHLNEPQIDWIETIRRFIGEFGRRSTYTYSRPSNRSESAGEYLPSLQRSLPSVVILIDTSSSISKSGLTQAVSEVNSICVDLGIEVRVIVIDANIHSDVIISDVDGLNLSGNGGSNFIPAFERLESEGFTGIVIAMTDGDITVPSAKPEHIKEILWLIGNNDKPPTHRWGEVIRVSSDIF